MGQNARIVVTGDVTQVDLPTDIRSGLADAVERLSEVPGVAAVILDRTDIVRHPLVQAIVDAYEEVDAAREREAPGGEVPIKGATAAGPGAAASE